MKIYHANSGEDRLLRQSTQTAKKNYVCCHCQEQIKKNTRYVRQIATYDGYFADSQSHPACQENFDQFQKEQARKR